MSDTSAKIKETKDRLDAIERELPEIQRAYDASFAEHENGDPQLEIRLHHLSSEKENKTKRYKALHSILFDEQQAETLRKQSDAAERFNAITTAFDSELEKLAGDMDRLQTRIEDLLTDNELNELYGLASQAGDHIHGLKGTTYREFGALARHLERLSAISSHAEKQRQSVLNSRQQASAANHLRPVK